MSHIVSLLMLIFTVTVGNELSCSGCPKILQMIFATSCILLLMLHILSEGKWPLAFFKKFKRNPNIPPYPFAKMIADYPFPLRTNELRNEVSIIEED